MQERPTRRTVLGAGLALPLATGLSLRGLPPAPLGRKKTLLVMGGTRFLGPAIVNAALDRGYEVTLFNRGKSNPHLFPDLEKLRGDRDTGDLAALEGRSWDLVVDTSLYLPSHAREVAELLQDEIGHYVVISTCSVYAEGQYGNVTEETPVGTITAEDEAQVTKIGDVMSVGGGRFYGPLKVRCEEELEAILPGRVTSLRPGVIAGRDDPSDRLPYWVVRADQGGEVLLPDVPDMGIQFTDARDLAEFSVDFGAAGKAGIYNAAGFAGKVTLQELAHGCKIVLGSDCSFTPVDEAFLIENEVRPFAELPFWLPEGYRSHFANEKGIEAGMRFRPIAETILETYEWHMEERGEGYEWRYYGMQPDRERDLLAKWHARPAAGEQQEASGG